MRQRQTPLKAALKGAIYSDVARSVGVDRSYISHLVAGRKRPSLDIAQRLAALLGTSVEALFPIVRRRAA